MRGYIEESFSFIRKDESLIMIVGVSERVLELYRFFTTPTAPYRDRENFQPL